MHKVMLVVLDGVGHRVETAHNAFALAKKPFIDKLLSDYPRCLLKTSGEAVGLPDGQMGNSEVGHMNLGAGRVVYMDLVRIDKAVRDGEFEKNAVFSELFRKLAASGKALHLMGLTSDGGVHSHYRHGLALVRAAKAAGVREICWHAFTDGRDTPPESGAGHVAEVEQGLAAIGAGRIASVIGRYYAMDRDKRWDRVERAYRALTAGQARVHHNAAAAFAEAYGQGETDEFIKPNVMAGADGKPFGLVKAGDGVIFFNFRADRAREITRAFCDDPFEGFSRERIPLAGWVCMTEHDAKFKLPVAFQPQNVTHTMGETIAAQGLAQLRIAETEKYAHVTFFFNGGVETPNPGEERILVPSPKEVPTYDHKPEMSAGEVTDKLIDGLKSGKFGFVLINYANGDMVGHTGVEAAAIKAVETVDACLARMLPVAWEAGYDVIVTADHGNCEMMVDPATGEPHTAHTTGPVHAILAAPRLAPGFTLTDGILADVAPTLLAMAGIPQPPEMTGHSLLKSR